MEHAEGSLAQASPAVDSLEAYVGQEQIKNDLQARIKLAKRHSRPLPHILLCGPPEMGKATLAYIISREMGNNIKPAHGIVLRRPRDFATLLTNLEDGDLLFIDQIESLTGAVLEALIQAIGDFTVDMTVTQGSSARIIKLDLKRFRLVGTTSKPSQVDKRLRRWMILYDFAPYNLEAMAKIIELLAEQKNLTLVPEASLLLAEYCERSPGSARVLIKRLHNYISASKTNHVTSELAREALASFGYLSKCAAATDLAGKLCGMGALEFEEFVAELLRKMTHAVEITKGSADHGLDLLMRTGNQLIGVQCKRWTAPVGEAVVRDFYNSLVSAGAQSGYVITTSAFSSHAFSFVENKPIKLIDLDALIDLATRGEKTAG